MQRPQTPNQIAAVDPHHLAAGKEISQQIERLAVVGIVERGHQHQPVRDIEIGIACGQPLALKDDRRGHGQLNDGEWPALRIARRAQPLQVLRQGQMILVGGIWLRDGDDGNGTNETSDVVHVAVRVIPGDAAIHPQHLVNAEIVVEDALQILAA